MDENEHVEHVEHAPECEVHPEITGHDAVDEVHPAVDHAPPEPETAAPPAEEPKRSLPGWPRVRYHPVHGGREFADPYEAAEFGQDDEKGDWRFKSAAAADMARTDTEAGLAIFHNMRTKVAQIDEQNAGVVRNSAAAQESLDAGRAEPL